LAFKKLSAIALAGIVTVLATAAPGLADGRRGPGFSGRGSVGQVPRHFDGGRRAVPQFRGDFRGGQRFDGHRRFDHRFDGHRFHNRAFITPFIAAPFLFSYTYPPAYVAPPTTYWYCPSYGAYYPQVQSCPEQWVPVTPGY
jgi:hypothetical protein